MVDDRPSGQIESDQENANLVQQIKDLQERLDQLERFALTSQNIIANKIGVGVNVVMANILDGDIATIPWTDYSNISTIIGFSGTPTIDIYYKKIGKLMFVNYYLGGTSDAADLTFTVPYISTSANSFQNPPAFIQDNGVVQTTSSRARLPTGSDIVTIYKDASTVAFAASGSKIAIGQLLYEATS